jgi:hypothetical protein
MCYALTKSSDKKTNKINVFQSQMMSMLYDCQQGRLQSNNSADVSKDAESGHTKNQEQ